MKTGHFSIIMPAYNAEKTLNDSIKSVLNQSYSDFTLYIINDNSTDKTESIIQSFNDSRIVYIKNESNYGVAKTRNVGIKLADGEFICFLDSDDMWLEDKLEKQYPILLNGWSVVCSNYYTFSDDNVDLYKERVCPETIDYNSMLKSNFIGNLTGVYNCSHIGKIYQKDVGHEDYIMWLEILHKAKKAYCMQTPYAKYRISNNSLSGNKAKAIKWQWKIYRNILKFSILKSSYYFSHYIINALKKRKP